MKMTYQLVVRSVAGKDEYIRIIATLRYVTCRPECLDMWATSQAAGI